MMFMLAKECGRDTCFQCEKKIEFVEEFSIEHKKPWLDNSPELFWNLNNIGFSHLLCNIKAGRKPTKWSEEAKAGYRRKRKKFSESDSRAARKHGEELPAITSDRAVEDAGRVSGRVSLGTYIRVG